MSDQWTKGFKAATKLANKEIEKLEAWKTEHIAAYLRLEAQLDEANENVLHNPELVKLRAQLAAVRAVPHEIRKLLPKLDVKSWGIITQAIRAAIGEGS